jgi:hypothetical protein
MMKILLGWVVVDVVNGRGLVLVMMKIMSGWVVVDGLNGRGWVLVMMIKIV